MWLINTINYQLEEFVPEECPEFAILSHRWQNEEVTFEDMKHINNAKSKRGFMKISKTCELAQTLGLEYAWIDTCCINRDSSAELSESINSMFRWYKQSQKCFAYLHDIDVSSDKIDESVWFTRGWTLQELIAPEFIDFYSSSWDIIGTKADLVDVLTNITGIDRDVLWGHTELSSIAAATKMSWAARRTTTRREDTAYCLLGIFDVNMPLLYGEGDKAFRRLQEEIIRRSDDSTIFAWRQSEIGHTGLLATSPAMFANVQGPSMLDLKNFPPAHNITVTNRGIQLTVNALLYSANIYAVETSCCDVRSGKDFQIYFYLSPLQTLGETEYRCARVHSPAFQPLEPTASNMWYDMCPANTDVPKKHQHRAYIPMTFIVPDHPYGVKTSAIDTKRLGIKVGVQGGNQLFNEATDFEGSTTTDSQMCASLPLYRYGIVWTLFSTHLLLDCLSIGFSFDSQPVLIATTRISSPDSHERHPRWRTIQNLITSYPVNDPDWFQVDMRRSKQLTDKIWQKACNESSRGHRLLDFGYENQAREPSESGLWIFRPRDGNRFTIILPECLRILCHFERLNTHDVSYEVTIVVRS